MLGDIKFKYLMGLVNLYDAFKRQIWFLQKTFVGPSGVCEHRQNVVATLNDIIFSLLSSLSFTTFSHRSGCPKVLKFCVGS